MSNATPLTRLVYYSRNRLRSSRDDLLREIDQILAVSRRNNVRTGVTGALIFNDGIFAQVLEGEPSQVEATFERIQRDGRHGDVQILAFGPVAARGFPAWSMGFLGQSRQQRDMFGHIGTASGFDARRLEGERVFEIMREIALDEERNAA